MIDPAAHGRTILPVLDAICHFAALLLTDLVLLYTIFTVRQRKTGGFSKIILLNNFSHMVQNEEKAQIFPENARNLLTVRCNICKVVLPKFVKLHHGT